MKEKQYIEQISPQAYKEGVEQGLQESVKDSSVLDDSISNAGQSIEVATENGDLDATIEVLTSQLKRSRIVAIAIWGIAIVILIARLLV